MTTARASAGVFSVTVTEVLTNTPGEQDLRVEVRQSNALVWRFTVGHPDRSDELPTVSINRSGRFVVAFLSYDPDQDHSRLEAAVFQVAGRRTVMARRTVHDNIGWDSQELTFNKIPFRNNREASDFYPDFTPSVSMGTEGRWSVAFLKVVPTGRGTGRTTDVLARRYEANNNASRTIRLTRSDDLDSRVKTRLHSGGEFAVVYEYLSGASRSIDTGARVVVGVDPIPVASEEMQKADVNETSPLITATEGTQDGIDSIVVRFTDGGTSRTVRLNR
jgi:hypothetical protein